MNPNTWANRSEFMENNGYSLETFLHEAMLASAHRWVQGAVGRWTDFGCWYVMWLGRRGPKALVWDPHSLTDAWTVNNLVM